MKPLLIVDGYNVIGAWREAVRKQYTIDEARDRLVHLLTEFSGYRGLETVVVFDGYNSDRPTATREQQGDVTVVYTRHGETADSYIERLAMQAPKYRSIQVATSDGQIQTLALGAGASRITSRELLVEMEQAHRTGYVAYAAAQPLNRHSLSDRLPREIREKLERARRGE